MEKTITIGTKEYLMKSSAFTPIAYKNETGKSLITELTNIANKYQDLDIDKMDKMELLSKFDELEEILTMTLRIAYIMSKEAKSINGSFDEFLMGIDNYLDNLDWMMEVVMLAMTPLSGGIQNIKIS